MSGFAAVQSADIRTGRGQTMDIGNSLQKALDGFFAFLPNLLGFLLILIIGYVVARVVASVVRKVLEKVRMDRKLHESDTNRYVDRIMPGASPSNGIARVVFWLIFVFFLFSAIGALQIPAVTTFMNQVLAYLPNVIAAILIFVLAAVIAGAVARAVARVMGDTPTGKVVASILPAIVLVIAMFMILQQLQIAEEIVQIAFAATMGALALGLALAFGLGGRPVAQRMLEDAYRKSQEQREQIKRHRHSDDRAEQQDREPQQPIHSGAAPAGSYDPHDVRSTSTYHRH
jgi:small-conductance mechanosensitive channel